MIGLSEIEEAGRRIAGHVRRTPTVEASCLRTLATPARLMLKLESLQPTGSFKVRGASNKLLATPRAALEAGIVTASGGNHGLAVARAGSRAGVPATIFLPDNASQAKRDKLAAWGATVEIVGSVWDEANEAAIAFAQRHGAVYVHAFADPLVVAGQGTIGPELLAEVPEIDTVLIAVGGGGLIAGIATALKALKPDIEIIGIEPVGAPTLAASREAGRVVTLPSVTTTVATMVAGRTDERVFEIVERLVDRFVLVEDEDMLQAARWLWFELGIAADLSGAAAVSALLSGRLELERDRTVVALVCGAGPEGIG